MKPTILVVDPNQADLLFFQTVLERSGYHVASALEPRAALDLLEDLHMDLLMTDLWLPEMDGFQLIRRARAVQPDIATLVLTDYSDMETSIKMLHRGVDGLILKPVENTDELFRVVEQTLSESHSRNETVRSHALRPLFDLTEQLLAETEPRRLEDLIVNSILHVFQAVYAAMYCRSPQTQRLQKVRSAGISPPEADVDAVAVLAEHTCAWGAAAVLLPQPNLALIGWESCLAAPVQRQNDYVIFAGRSQGMPQYTEADLEMFVILCRQAVMVLENARLFDERKSHLRRLEESNRALVQTEKMAAIGRLVASLAHEINNPLQAVRNGLHLLMRDDIEAEKRDQYLSMTKREVDRLVETVQRMLDFSRSGKEWMSPTDVEYSLTTVLELLQPQLKQQEIEVHRIQSGDKPLVFAISDQIAQVILNLFINAMDSIEEKIQANPAAAWEPREIWVELTATNDQVRLQIEDSGAGIRSELGEQVFEPFVSTKSHGTGLGLSVSYEIIEHHGGTIAIVPPKYGTGACFAVTLPRYIENSA